MEEGARKALLPYNMRCLVLASAFIPMYSFVSQVALSDKHEIVFSLVGSASAILALAGGSYRSRFVIGSVANLLPVLCANRYLRAFIIGVVTGYLQTCCELYACSMCSTHYRKEAFVLARLSIAIVATIALFIMRFMPHVRAALLSPLSAVSFSVAQIVVAALCVIETPEEALDRSKGSRTKKGMLFDRIFKTLAFVYGPSTPGVALHEEYKELIEKSYEPRKAAPLARQVKAVASKINVSFVYLGLQFTLCSKKQSTIYSILLGAVQMFCWFIAHELDDPPFVSTFFLLGSLFMLVVSTGQVNVLLMSVLVCGFTFMPQESSILTLSPKNLVLADFAKALLGSAVFWIVMYLWPD